MKTSKITAIVAVILLSGTAIFAQLTDQTGKNRVTGKVAVTYRVFNYAAQGEVPPGANGWKIQIFSKAGVLDYEKADLILTSDGILSRRDTEAAGKPLSGAELSPLSQLISILSIPEPSKTELQPSLDEAARLSLCSTCEAKAVMVSRREADGKIKRIISIWDETTKAKTPKNMVEIYEAVIKLTGSKE